MYMAVILFVILYALSAFHVVGGRVDEIFRNGKDSLWQIAVILAVFSALYPSMGFGRRTAVIPGSYQEIRADVLQIMVSKGYKLEKEEGENLSFRHRSPVRKATRMFEDRLTFTRTISGFEIEGPVKDSVRVISALEYRFRSE